MPMPRMRVPKSHNVIVSGNSGRLIVAADFPATGRTVAGFTDLFGSIAAPPLGDTVWETAPPPIGAETTMSGADHVDRWVGDLPVPDEGAVRAVLGFCVGAVFAAAIAAHVEERQGEPPVVVLFDPERPDPDLLLRHYTGVIDGLAFAASQAERAAALSAGRQARDENDGMDKLAAALGVLFVEHGAPILARTGLDQHRQDELRDTFASFLGYLVAAAELDPTPVWRRASAISSQTAHSGLNPLPADVRAGAVGRELRFAVPHTELLRHDEVVRTCRDLLGKA
jgi:hypothetical protein